MIDPIESAPNIGFALASRLKAVGVHTIDDLHRVGEHEVWRLLLQHFPADAGTHARLALAGAVRGVRWHRLPETLRDSLRAEVLAQ